MKIDLTQTHDVEGAFNSIDWSDIKTKYHDPATLRSEEHTSELQSQR